jgi:hypothetical protein
MVLLNVVAVDDGQGNLTKVEGKVRTAGRLGWRCDECIVTVKVEVMKMVTDKMIEVDVECTPHMQPASASAVVVVAVCRCDATMWH